MTDNEELHRETAKAALLHSYFFRKLNKKKVMTSLVKLGDIHCSFEAFDGDAEEFIVSRFPATQQKERTIILRKNDVMLIRTSD